jgi:hypothetical protein
MPEKSEKGNQAGQIYGTAAVYGVTVFIVHSSLFIDELKTMNIGKDN